MDRKTPSSLRVVRGLVALLIVTAATACARRQEPPPAPPAEAPIPATSSPFAALPEGVRLVMDKPFTGDFDEMVERRAIRVAVTFNRTHYFIDKGQERGLTYEALKSFESDLNADLKTGNLKVYVVLVPMSRDQLYPALASGKVDMVAAMVTVRPELEALVAFSEPTRTNVSEVVVTGPGAPPIATVDDLAGEKVFVRKASVYHETLTRLNGQLKARGKPGVVIDEAPGVMIDVTDNGPGIIREALNKIFVPFFTTKKSGSGIGLSLSRQIMQMHNGALTVESEPDVKTVFRLKF